MLRNINFWSKIYEYMKEKFNTDGEVGQIKKWGLWTRATPCLYLTLSLVLLPAAYGFHRPYLP